MSKKTILAHVEIDVKTMSAKDLDELRHLCHEELLKRMQMVKEVTDEELQLAKTRFVAAIKMHMDRTGRGLSASRDLIRLAMKERGY